MSGETMTAISRPRGSGKAVKRARKLKATAADMELLELWLTGVSYRQIAASDRTTLSHEGVRNAINRALERLAEETSERAQKAQSVELARLDRLLAACWLNATAGDTHSIREARQIIALRARIEGLLSLDDAGSEMDAILAERERLAEVHGEAIVQVLVLVLGDAALGLDPEKQEVARRLAGRHLREIESGDLE